MQIGAIAESFMTMIEQTLLLELKEPLRLSFQNKTQ